VGWWARGGKQAGVVRERSGTSNGGHRGCGKGGLSVGKGEGTGGEVGGWV